jgi:hypothetical protein
MPRRAKASGNNLTLGIGDVAKAATAYTQLGLRVVERTERRAVVVLPCGIRLVLTGAPG